MALTVTEFIQSRDVQTTDGVKTGLRVFHVTDGALVSLTPEMVEAAFGTPTTPDPLPKKDAPFPGYTELLAEDFKITRPEGMTDTLRVEWSYEQRIAPVLTDPTDPTEPDQLGYVEFSLDQSAEFREVWRSNPNVGAPALVDGVPQMENGIYKDIGGQAVDNGTEPGSALRMQQVLEIHENMQGQPNTITYSQAIGKRNSTVFYGAPVGIIALASVRSSTISQTIWRASFRFVWDEWYHCEQKVSRDIHGTPFKTPVGEGPPYRHFRAEHVYWIQPFPGTYDFNTLSSRW